MNLIVIEPEELSGDLVRLTDQRARHLRQVLGVTPGATVRIGLLNGPFGVGTVAQLEEGAVHVRCVFGQTPPHPRIDLLLALPRPKVLRRLWPQLSALGVGRIVLTNAERVERDYFDTHILSPASYRPLLIEGLQQAKDTHLPVVSIHRRFRVLVEDELDQLVPPGLRLMADPAAVRRLADAVPAAVDRVLLAVGPEGGWNEFERELLAAHGFSAVGLGPRTLRSDTACVALLALLGDAIGARQPAGADSGPV